MSAPQHLSVFHHVVEKMMEKINIKEYQFDIDGNTGNVDGFVGEIVFFHVWINNQKSYFVWKSEKPHQYLKDIGLSILCNRELDVYTNIIPALEEFTMAKNWPELSTFIPNPCFVGKVNNLVNIVLENLKHRDFHTLDRRKRMDFPHMKALFEAFGKWHGTSMAYRDQHPEKFLKLVGNWVDPRFQMFKSMGFVKQFKKEFAIIQKMLVERKRFDLVKVYEGVDDDIESVMFRTNVDEKDLMIISHGDNWTSNYMFKYEEDSENSTPNQVYLIDLQVSRLDSPALELSSSLYNMGDKTTFEKLDDLLAIYHEYLSDTLRSLGSDPDKIFTMEDLRRHWKKYGFFSALSALGYLRIMLCDHDEAPDLAKMAEDGSDFDGAFGFQLRCMDTFWEKALDVFIHYGEFLKN